MAKSSADRYCERRTVTLRRKSTGIYILLANYATRSFCPFCLKNKLNKEQSTLIPLSISYQFIPSSYSGALSRKKTANALKYSTTTSVNLSERWVRSTSVNLRMASRILSVALLFVFCRYSQKQFKISILASSSASESNPLCCYSNLSSPISMELSAAYCKQCLSFYFCGKVKEGLPLLGLKGLGMVVPGWERLPCLFFLWFEKAGQEEYILPQPHWYFVFYDFVIIIIKERLVTMELIDNKQIYY